MSYSKEELQAMFDDVISIMSDVMSNFMRDGLVLLFSTESAAELVESEAYINFKQGYGEESAEFLLEAKRKVEERNLQTPALEEFWSHEVFSYFGADGIANIWVHWITKQPPYFKSLLHKYPGILSLLHERNSAVISNALEEAIETYRPSAAVLAEYMAEENRTEKALEFIRTAGPKLAAFGTAVGFLRKEEKEKAAVNEDCHWVNSVDSLSLDSNLVSAEEKERVKKRSLGADAALALLVDDNKKQLATEQEKITSKIENIPLALIYEYNRIALELAILEGKESFEAVVIGHREKKLTTVSSVIGRNSVGKSSLETLESADKARTEIQKFIWLEFVVNIKRKIVSDSVVNGASAPNEIYQYNQAALELAIIEGKENFDAVVAGEKEKRRTQISSVIGRNPVGKSMLERLNMADEMEGMIERKFQMDLMKLRSQFGESVDEKENQKILEKIIILLRSKLESISEEDSTARKEMILKIAVLEGKDTFRMMDGKMQKISSTIGFDTANMTAAHRFKTAENIGALIAETDTINSSQDEQKKEQSAERVSYFLLSIKRKELEQSTVNYKSTPEKIAQYNEDVLRVAILEGKRSCKAIIQGQRLFRKRVKIEDMIGANPAKMTPSQRLQAAANVEVFKAFYASTLGLQTVEELQVHITALGDFDAIEEPDKAKMYQVLSEASAILNRAPKYQLQPKPNSQGETVFVDTVPEYQVDIFHAKPAERLELYRRYCKENKEFFPDDGKASSKLVNLLESFKNLIKAKIKEFIPERPKTSEALSRSKTVASLKEDVISERNRSSSPPLLTRSLSTGHMTLFGSKADIGQVKSDVSKLDDVIGERPTNSAGG